MEAKVETTKGFANTPDYHPFDDAGFFSKLFYLYMLPLFRLGFKKDLNEHDLLPPANTHNSTDLGDKLEISWNHEVETKTIPSLWSAIWRVYWKDFVFTGCIWVLLETFIKSSQPLCMSKFLEYYRPHSTMTLNEVYIYAGLIILILFLQVIVNHYYLLNILQLGLRIRISVGSLIYRKALKLSKSSLAETTIGQMVNLMSNDLNRFDAAVVQFHALWYCPIQALIVMSLCYIYLGPTAMTGVILLVLFIPFQMWMAKKTSIFRNKTATRTDERIRLMNEIISGIQVIKMYTWEKPFVKLVELARRKELLQIRNISFIRATIGSLNLFLNRCSQYLCLLTFVLLGNIPNAQYLYTLTTFYTLLQYAITILFPQGITQFAEVSISIKRLHKFLMYEEIQKQKVEALIPKALENKSNEITNDEVGVNINRASVKWISSQAENNLHAITLDVQLNQVLAIVGPVGSGKTTLLHVILKELPVNEGSINVNGTISYASQEPWLFVGTVRQNITFGQEFNLKKYQEVVKVCALERDFALFPFGDKTIAGERGVTLSGGQKARINLARAVYKDADIYLLDDPLSAVDAHVGKHIFNECISGYLRNKAVVLVTHQLQYLHNVQKIYLLENGRVQASGTYEELQKTDKEFTKLLNDHKEEEEEDEKKGKVEDKEKETLNEDNNDDGPKMQKENRGIGNISWAVYSSYILSGGHWCKIIALLSGFILSQVAASLTDYFQAIWVNLEQERAQRLSIDFNKTEDLNSISVDGNDNIQYSLWKTFLTEKNCLYIYTALIGLTVILTLSRSFAFYRFTIKASLRLHNNMFKKIVYAAMKFFHSNPSGRILNRFSNDIGSIDEQLPMIFLDTIQIAFIVTATLIVIGSLNPWMFLPTVIIFVIFYVLRTIYLRTSRDVKRLEGTTRSPIYSHLNASLQGLTTIRAFGAQQILQKEFDKYQDMNASAWFTFVGCARSFGLWLDIHCVAYVGLVTVSFLFLQTEIFGGSVGLAITQALSLTGMFQWGMRQWSEMENRMTCVERVKEYADVVPESDQGTKEAPKSWPEKGDIRFDQLCLKYDENDPYILKNLSFSVKSAEKVGIVGRTGAGKSSIIAALFRLAVVDGKIIIDSIDSKDISLNKLRSVISIIPQEPVLFSGTLRKNLDPFDVYSDEVLWSALEEVELKVAVSDLPLGLGTRMSEGGSNFSVGQRQLVCLARAIVQNNRILILDEATANVDPQTDALIQSTIRRKFFDCTVLTIAHRLHTIMDSHKVLVMDAGKSVEFGQPYELLQKKGAFYSLVKQTGKATMDNLEAIAKKIFRDGQDLGVDGRRHAYLFKGNISLPTKQGKVVLSLQMPLLKLLQPIILAHYLEYFNKESNISKAEAYQYAGYMILSNVVVVFLYNIFLSQILAIGYKFRISTSSLIYRKAISIDKTCLAEISIGKIVNLYGIDSYRLHDILVYGQFIWLAPLEICIILYLMYYHLGLSTVVGSLLCISSVLLQAWLNKNIYVINLKASIKVDERLKIMNDIIMGIRVIKMYTWEKPFAKLIAQLRKEELRLKFHGYIIKAILFSLNFWLNRTAIYVTMAIFVLSGNIPTPVYIFTLSCFHDMLKLLLTQFFNNSLTGWVESAISIGRIQAFLEYNETSKKRKYLRETFAKVDEICFTGIGVSIVNASVKWGENTSVPVLSNINLKIVGPQLIAIVGPVGSGKSSLLYLILKELHPIQGAVAVQGNISYASQEPWLFDGSIRDNIIIGRPFNQTKYEEVINVCALERDLVLFPCGDNSLVGERGIALSGGQKARINLARAVYADADIYLLDDPLSAVDAHVGNHIFEQCISNYLRDKCVFLVTHQLQYLDKVKRICVVNGGEIRLTENIDAQLEAKINNDYIFQTDQDSKEKILKSESKAYENKKLPDENKEHKEVGAVAKNVYLTYAQAGGYGYAVVVLVHFVVAQILASFSDYFLSLWANFYQWNSTRTIKNNTHDEYQEPIWKSLFTSNNSLILYSILIGMIICLSISRNIWFFKTCMNAGLLLHNQMLDKLCKADMSFFFRNCSGRILNRLSRDIGKMDEVVPVMMYFTFQGAMAVTGMAIMIGVANTWLIVPSLILFVIFYILHLIFIPTCTSLKRLDAITGSYTMSHLTATLQGLSTIRAFGAQTILKKEFDFYENRNGSAFFLIICANRALSVWMDLHCLVYISVIILSFLFMDGEIFGGNVGVAITQSLSTLTLFQSGMKQWTELKIQMTSVERIKEYIDIKPEKDQCTENPLKIWPTHGDIEFRNVSLRYYPDDPFVIKDIDFNIKSCEKIGIVGRTGAGKTSIINALFRLIKVKGNIFIDNVDIWKLPLHQVRSSISIIPQDPAMFSGSIRSNLDPFGKYNDEVLWKSLEDVELKSTINQLDNGLDTLLTEGGSNFSIGQKQLLCIARALLRNNKIIVLDEATANVDLKTDQLIQLTIQRKLLNCTILVVAHRLHTVMDLDRILVMDEGVIVEFDHPYVLLQNQIGIFKQLVDQTGIVMAQKLEKIAKKVIVSN